MEIKYKNTISEQDMLFGLKKGDIVAFEQLYHHYKGQFASNFLRLLKSESLAEDFLHDLFIKVWENRSQINTEKSFQSYLYRIAENMVFDFFRKTSHEQRLQNQIFVNSENMYFHVEETIIDKERKTLLDEAIKELSPQCRLVFKLCKIEGRSYDEVSRMLEISPSTISNHLMKAKKQLRNRLVHEADWVIVSLCILALIG